MVGIVEGLEDGDWNGTESGRRRFLLHVGCKLSSQTKSELSHLVVPGVVVPHSCEDLANQPNVLFHKPILDRSPCGWQDSGTDTLDDDLEERDGIRYALEIGRDVQPTAECVPLGPVGELLLVDCGGEIFSEGLLCGMEVSCCLHADGRGSSRQGF